MRRLAAKACGGGGRLAALQRAGYQRKRSHGDPAGPSRKDQGLAGIEAGERFAGAARRADAQELGRTAGHAPGCAGDGVEVWSRSWPCLHTRPYPLLVIWMQDEFAE